MNALITEILTAALAADPAHLQRAALACGAPDWATLTARPLTPSVQDCGGGTQLLVADLSPRHQLCLGDRGRVPTGTARIYLAVYDRALGDELYWTRIEAGQVTARGGRSAGQARRPRRPWPWTSWPGRSSRCAGCCWGRPGRSWTAGCAGPSTTCSAGLPRPGAG